MSSRHECLKCPDSLAAKRAAGSLVAEGARFAVYPRTLAVYERRGALMTRHAHLPQVATDFIRAFDLWGPREPFEFEIDLLDGAPAVPDSA